MDWFSMPLLRVFLAIGLLALAGPLAKAQESVVASKTPLDGPTALATDRVGHLFVLESGRVRRIDLSTGDITTVAGDGRNLEIEDGRRATEFFLGSLRSLAIDAEGSIFLGQGSQVRRVDAQSGVLSTVAGQFKGGRTIEGIPASDAQFWDIDGLAVSASGDLFIADGVQRKIFKIDADTRIVRTYAGSGRMGLSGDGGPAVAATFEWANSITLNSNGDLFIADMEACRIRWVDHASGIINSIGSLSDVERGCGERTSQPHGASSYSQPKVDADGSVYVADEAGDMILRVDWGTSKISVVAGRGTRGYSGDGGPASHAELANPSGVAVDSEGNLFISEFLNNRIRRVDGKTHLITTFAGNGPFRNSDSGVIIEAVPAPQPTQDSPGPLVDPLPLPIGRNN